jgi:hypothetical protein
LKHHSCQPVQLKTAVPLHEAPKFPHPDAGDAPTQGGPFRLPKAKLEVAYYGLMTACALGTARIFARELRLFSALGRWGITICQLRPHAQLHFGDPKQKVWIGCRRNKHRWALHCIAGTVIPVG